LCDFASISLLFGIACSIEPIFNNERATIADAMLHHERRFWPKTASGQRTNPLSREGAGGAIGRIAFTAVTI
jgi:hypothetical protein